MITRGARVRIGNQVGTLGDTRTVNDEIAEYAVIFDDEALAVTGDEKPPIHWYTKGRIDEVLAPEPFELEFKPMTTQEFAAFITGLINLEIVTNEQIPQKLVPLVFAPLSFGGLRGYSDGALDRIGVAYAYMKDALPRQIDGYPIFHRVYLCGAEDWRRAKPIVRAALEAKRSRQQ